MLCLSESRFYTHPYVIKYVRAKGSLLCNLTHIRVYSAIIILFFLRLTSNAGIFYLLLK